MGEIEVSDREEIRFLTIRNEPSRNALTRDMVEATRLAVEDFETDPELKVVVLQGAGAQSFCSGADMKEIAEQASLGQVFVPVLPTLYESLLHLSKPSIAALNGDAVGGGLELALCCDLRIARTGARVGLPEISLGMVPRYGTVLAARVTSAAVALDLALLGELLPVEKSPVGLVSRVARPEEFSKEVLSVATQLAKQSSVAMSGIKHLANGAGTMEIRELVDSPEATAAFGSPDWAEGVTTIGERSHRRIDAAD
jgi:enoyl-CoA hydratase